MKRNQRQKLCVLVLFLMMMSIPAMAGHTLSPGSSTSVTVVEVSSASALDTAQLVIPVSEDAAVASGSEADTPHGAGTMFGGVWCGKDSGGLNARSWLKFDLKHIPKEAIIQKATLAAYWVHEFQLEDEPFGVYNSMNNTWYEGSITWNTQPTFAVSPTDVIDTPASPNMFVLGTWYEWDVTADVSASLSGDKILTEVLKQVDETAVTESGGGFASREYSKWNATYLALEYTTPTTTNLAVDGHSSAPQIDYIQDSTPVLSWETVDSPGDFQRDYQAELWSDHLFNETLLWSDKHTEIATVYDSSGSVNSRPFGTADEMRYQMKFPSAMIPRTGIVDKLHFEVDEESGVGIYENLVVYMAGTSTAGDLTADFEANYGIANATVVLSADSYEAVIEDYVLTFDLENTFYLSSDLNLIIELRFTDNVGTLASTIQTNAAGGSHAYEYDPGAYWATTAGYVGDRTHSLDIEFASEEIFEGSVSANSYPFGVTLGIPGWFHWKYNKSMISETGYIDRIWIPVVQESGATVYANLTVRLVETPVLGVLSADKEANYGGAIPTTVLTAETYEVRCSGKVIVLDVANTFRYTGNHDLLIEMEWDSRVSGDMIQCLRTVDAGGYRAWNLTSSAGSDTRTYDMSIEFTYPEEQVECDYPAMVNSTRYYWRVRSCDSLGRWSAWSTQSFKYESLSTGPSWTDLVVNPTPAIVSSPVTVSLDATYFLGVDSVWIDYDGTNNSMTAAGDTFSYTWTPSATGNVTFTIYMESAIGTWSAVSGEFQVLAGGVDPTLLLIAAGGAAVVIVIIVVAMAKRRSGSGE